MDAPAVAAVTDAWMPAIFTRIDESLFVPTIDLTVHFRSSLPHPGLEVDDFVLAVFRTTVTADGFMEEDGEVWAPDGTLLAQSRQLAATYPPFGPRTTNQPGSTRARNVASSTRSTAVSRSSRGAEAAGTR